MAYFIKFILLTTKIREKEMKNKQEIKLQKPLRSYASLVKFSHTIFALPFALIGFFLAVRNASALPSLWILLAVILCMVFARNAAMGFNRYIDRHIDMKNPRTQLREIPAGVITEKRAFWFVVINSIFFIATTLFINKLVFYLSPVTLVVILGYSYTKRFTALCHFVLGIGLSLAPIGAYLAVAEQFDTVPVLVSVVVLLWVSGFDIIYALQDIEFDKKENLKSIPTILGKSKALKLSLLLHFLVITIIIYIGFINSLNFSVIYWVGVILFSGLLLFQHTIISPNDLNRVNHAFFTTNGIASVVYALFVILEIYL